MKKKLKDITIGEMAKACSKHRKCERCPFNDFFCCGFVVDMDVAELEKEYDVKEDKK